jgi:hypothetical protein
LAKDPGALGCRRQDRVDDDAAAPNLLGEHFYEVLRRKLAPSAQTQARRWIAGCTRADVDDPSVVGDVRARILERQEGSFCVDRKYPIELLFRDVINRRVIGQFNAGVCDDNVESAEPIECPGEQVLDVGHLRDVSPQCNGLATEAFDRSGCFERGLPDTSMRCALTHRFSSARSSAIIGPMSSGKPARPSAVISEMRLFNSGLSRTMPLLKSVAMGPGATTLR